MRLSEFVCKNNGKKVDYDRHYGAQCVDLYRQYCADVLGVKQSPPVVGAKDLIDNPGELNVMRDFPLADYTPGDVLIWGATDKNPYGHVAILLANCGKNFIVFEQDGFKQDGARLALRGRENLLGCMWRGVRNGNAA